MKSSGPLKAEFEAFKKKPSIAVWLEEAALFAAIDAEHPECQFWWDWPAELRDRKGKPMREAKARNQQFVSGRMT